MSKILIIGKNGNLGMYFLDLYQDQDVSGVGFDDLDITNEKQVMKKISELNPDIVINCAAYNAVDKAETDPGAAEAVNGYGPSNIAKACKEIGATMVHFSSGMVFDGKNPEGYKEDDDLTHPINAYGRSKLIGEMEIQNNLENYYIIRTCWLFGKKGPDNTNKLSFIDQVLEKAKSEDTIFMVNDEFGNPTYMLDLAQATRALLEEKKPFGIYHLTNSGMCSRFDWANEIFRINDVKKTKLIATSGENLKRPAKRLKYEVLNNTKYIQLRPWAEALKEFLEQ